MDRPATKQHESDYSGTTDEESEELMARTRRDDERLLTSDEQEIVAQTRHPALRDLSDSQLSDLVKRLRDRRDRAQGIARQQRREVRGKAAPVGARAASDNSGTREKGALLSAALKRANKESTRRRTENAKTELTRHAERVLEMVQGSGSAKIERPQSRTSDEGMRSFPNEGIAPSGAFEQEGGRPVLERSRKVR